MSDPSASVAALAALAANITAAGDDEWLQVETNARSIADILRTKTSAGLRARSASIAESVNSL